MDSSNQKSETIQFAAGELIVKEGDPGGDVFIIRSGSVEVFRTRNGRDWTLAELKEGEIIGAMTAASGGCRAASARAMSGVTAVLVKSAQINDLLKKMPPWGLALIKDLVARVEYCNNLYVETASHAIESNSTDDPLTLASLVASTIYPVMQLMGIGGKHVPFDEFVAKMAEILGIDVLRIEFVLNVFLDEKLLLSLDGDPEERQFDLRAAKRINAFSKFVSDLRIRLKDPDGSTALLAIGEREILMQIANNEIAASKHPDEPVEITVSKLQNDTRRLSGTNIDVKVFKRADALGYLSLVNVGDQPTVKFVPSGLIGILNSYGAAKKISPQIFVDRKLKKTISY